MTKSLPRFLPIPRVSEYPKCFAVALRGKVTLPRFAFRHRVAYGLARVRLYRKGVGFLQKRIRCRSCS
jgi:hypothetical protein